MKYPESVDIYIQSRSDWKDCLNLLRELFLSTRLQETVKWGLPVYTLDNKNVAGFSAFKSFVGIWFFQGVFLKDPKKKLINAQEGVTKALRQWRFTSVEEIHKYLDTITEYLEEAIGNQEAGKFVKPARNKPLELPELLKHAISENPALGDSFHALSLSKRRDFAEYISAAKREETRIARLEKIIPMVLEGIGLQDKYKR